MDPGNKCRDDNLLSTDGIPHGVPHSDAIEHAAIISATAPMTTPLPTLPFGEGRKIREFFGAGALNFIFMFRSLIPMPARTPRAPLPSTGGGRCGET
ncbi:MAG: hypothetical protein K9G30_03710 [Parvibaculum sp.]|nr:hypothetical protein [Parvibaculum sp.]